MSRTIRRKNEQWDFHIWNSHDWIVETSKYGGTYMKEVYFEKGSIEYKKAAAHYYGDKKANCDNVPNWYILHKYQKPMRQKSRIVLSKWKEDQEIEVTIPVYKKNHGYY